MNDSTPVTRALDALKIPYRVFRHAALVNTLEQAAEERGQTPDQLIRSIVFRISKGEFVMVLIAGARQVAWPALCRKVGKSRLTMASEDEVLAATGYKRYTVSPLGLTSPMRILIDESVLAQREISIGSGERGLAVILSTKSLRKALSDAEVDIGNFAAT